MPPPRLDNLPFDVFYQIATSLDDRDSIQLSRTNRIIHDSMQSELIARITVEVSRAELDSFLSLLFLHLQGAKRTHELAEANFSR